MPTRKIEAEVIDGTPEKRMFWSIISDYGLQTGLCELIDNAIDIWKSGSQEDALNVWITLDVQRQVITVKDDAGGVKKDDLRLLIVPGGSGNDPKAEVIGIFGVGSKRASIALGEQVVIRTRHKKGQTFELDITNDWLESPDWEIASYSVPNIDPSTTQVDISHLREPFSDEDVEEIRARLGETYGWFLRRGCALELNGKKVSAKRFSNWAYPPGFHPRTATAVIDLRDGYDITAKITAGLIRDRDAETENYGVYIYCNDRLIVKELRVREVGYYVTSEAGVPHPDASLCRVIVELNGPAQAMPWNSTKSGINYLHPAFQAIRPSLIQLVSHFSSLSRRLKDDWDNKVFRYKTGALSPIDPTDIVIGRKLILPPLPRVNRPRVEKLKSANRSLIKDKPWVLGLIEALGAVHVVRRQKMDTRNRIALILLDSNFEIALKEFIVHRDDLFPVRTYTDEHIAQLFRNRTSVLNAVAGLVAIPQALIDRAKHYYAMRNKLIHERASVTVTDHDVENYQQAVEALLKLLFAVRVPAH